jgi:prepilin-type N-terminal cleavage/methylation domain-containing protein
VQASLERLRRRREDEGDEGFTLIELLIVIVILGILAAIVVFAVQNLSSSSSQASCGSDLKTAETAVEAYKAQMGGYPNAAAAGLPITDPTGPANAAVGGATPGALLVASSPVGGPATINVVSPSGNVVGPWLKDAPSNGTHYTITVSNDGVGTITVTTPADPGGLVLSATTPNPCSIAT